MLNGMIVSDAKQLMPFYFYLEPFKILFYILLKNASEKRI